MAASKRSRSVSSSGTSSGPADRHRSPKRRRRSRSRSRDRYRHHRESRDYRESRYTDDRRRDRHPRSRDDSLDRRREEQFDRPSGERHRSQHPAHPTSHAPASDAPPEALSIHRYWCRPLGLLQPLTQVCTPRHANSLASLACATTGSVDLQGQSPICPPVWRLCGSSRLSTAWHGTQQSGLNRFELQP